MRRFRVLLFQLTCIGILIFAANAAFADSNCVGSASSCSFTLNNTGVAGGSFVNATVTLNSVGNATIQFTAAPGDGIVAVSSLSLNVNTSLGYSGAFTGLTSNGLGLSIPACSVRRGTTSRDSELLTSSSIRKMRLRPQLRSQ